MYFLRFQLHCLRESGWVCYRYCIVMVNNNHIVRAKVFYESNSGRTWFWDKLEFSRWVVVVVVAIVVVVISVLLLLLLLLSLEYGNDMYLLLYWFNVLKNSFACIIYDFAEYRYEQQGFACPFCTWYKSYVKRYKKREPFVTILCISRVKIIIGRRSKCRRTHIWSRRDKNVLFIVKKSGDLNTLIITRFSAWNNKGFIQFVPACSIAKDFCPTLIFVSWIENKLLNWIITQIIFI